MKIQSVKSLIPAYVSFDDGNSVIAFVDLSNKKVIGVQWDTLWNLDKESSESIVNEISKYNDKAIEKNSSISEKVLSNATRMKDKYKNIRKKSNEIKEQYGS